MKTVNELILRVLAKIQSRKVFENLDLIENVFESGKDNMKKFQDDALRELLIHAYKSVPYYSKVLKECGVISGDLSVNLSKFEKIPVLTKEVIRREGKNLQSKDIEKRGAYKNTSGGSTGEPVEFWQDKNYDDWNNATKLFYFNRLLGKKIGEREIKLWGSDRDIIQGNLAFKDRVLNKLYNRKFFNCYNFGEKDIKELIKLNNTFKPAAYWSYMEAADEFSKYLIKNNIQTHHPRFIVSSIGPLYEKTRQNIEQALGCKVYDQYGSREVGIIAGENPKSDGMMYFSWYNKVEVSPYPEGNAIITNLRNYSMPLIRYDLGDVVLAKDESSLKKVMGRTLGYFKKADGSLVSTHFTVQALFFKDWIKQFQLIQEKLNEVILKIEIKEGFGKNDDDMKEISDKNKILFGNECETKFVFVDKILPSKSGKYIYTVCKI